MATNVCDSHLIVNKPLTLHTRERPRPDSDSMNHSRWLGNGNSLRKSGFRRRVGRSSPRAPRGLGVETYGVETYYCQRTGSVHLQEHFASFFHSFPPLLALAWRRGNSENHRLANALVAKPSLQVRFSFFD